MSFDSLSSTSALSSTSTNSATSAISALPSSGSGPLGTLDKIILAAQQIQQQAQQLQQWQPQQQVKQLQQELQQSQQQVHLYQQQVKQLQQELQQSQRQVQQYQRQIEASTHAKVDDLINALIDKVIQERPHYSESTLKAIFTEKFFLFCKGKKFNELDLALLILDQVEKSLKASAVTFQAASGRYLYLSRWKNYPITPEDFAVVLAAAVNETDGMSPSQVVLFNKPFFLTDSTVLLVKDIIATVGKSGMLYLQQPLTQENLRQDQNDLLNLYFHAMTVLRAQSSSASTAVSSSSSSSASSSSAQETSSSTTSSSFKSSS